MHNFSKNIYFSERLKFGFFQLTDHIVGREKGFKLFETSRRNLYKQLHTRLKQGEEGIIYPLEHVSNISQNDFKKKYIAKGKPLIIEGAALDWPTVKQWSLDYFKNLYGNEKVLYVDYQNHSTFERISLEEIISGIREKTGRYYRFYPLLQRHPEHSKDFDYNWLKSCRHKINWNENFYVFMGGKGSYSPLHNSFSNNIFTQVHGEKEWIIYPPFYSIIFDPDPAWNLYRAVSERQGDRFDSFKPDFETHPLFKYIDGYKVVLKPGDILYNPPYYWHTVKNIGDSIGVGYRWLPLWSNLKKWPLNTLMDLTSRKPNFFKTMKYLKQDVNLLHLAETGKLKSYLKEKKHG